MLTMLRKLIIVMGSSCVPCVANILFLQLNTDLFYTVGWNKTSAYTTLDCARRCFFQDSCASFSFDKARRECYWYSYELDPGLSEVPSDGFENFNIIDGKIRYELIVVTGNQWNADTEANVYIKIYGTKRSSEKLKLYNEVGTNFERNTNSTFLITYEDVGDITSVQLGHDRTRRNPGWYLQSLVIRKSLSFSERLYSGFKYKVYEYSCNTWIVNATGEIFTHQTDRYI